LALKPIDLAIWLWYIIHRIKKEGIEMQGEQATIKKISPAGYFQDSASWRGLPATYGIFMGELLVGMILGSERKFRDGASDWGVCRIDEIGCPREIQHFWNRKSFTRAKEFAMTYDWSEMALSPTIALV